ncbi:MAG: hypothetical protein LBG27_07590 [Spirochaetaceae bacterium]|nr:hypothetical protein [Spirochaetaceae bacterium]
MWQSDSNAYLLQTDGTAWRFSSDSFYKQQWSLSQINGQSITLSDSTFTRDGTTYTKNTSTTKTPGAADSSIQALWISGSSSMELESDGTAVITSNGDTITVGYCVAESKLYLLAPIDSPNDPVIIEITLTEDGKIDGSGYSIADSTLTISDVLNDGEDDLELTKVDSVPTETGAGGDARLHGAWTASMGSETVTFNANGTATLKIGNQSMSAIWKVSGGSSLSLYEPLFSSETQPASYSVSGSTLTYDGIALTKK